MRRETKDVRYKILSWVILFSWSGLLQAAAFILNNPYPERESLEKILYSSFAEQPKTLDPAKSYSSNEFQFIAQIYEPLLAYDYLARPYQLVPLTATEMPKIQYYDAAGRVVVDPEGREIAKSVYTLHVKSGIFYQPHPAFAKNRLGYDFYSGLSPAFLDENQITELSDFKLTGTRELLADDYIYQIKRLASPAVNSPIYGLMSEYIVGFRTFGHSLPPQSKVQSFLDLRDYPLEGVNKVDDHTFQITLHGLYPQFLFWLAMPFFAPIPWEVERFYAEPDMIDKNFDLGWYPVGTGPFMLIENNPNRRMVLAKNPNYRVDYFPSSGTKADRDNGYLMHAGERLPLIDKAIYTLEKESIPRWNKFLQGYYDTSGISSDSFDKAIQITSSGMTTLTPEMKAKGIHLVRMDEPAISYLGFNMLDPVVGGQSERARKLRQAISMAINFEEYIGIFLNGRGQAAQGVIPPGLFGESQGALRINPYVYIWSDNAPKRRSLAEAKVLMREAGYLNGRSTRTGKPLILHYDVHVSGGPDEKAQLNWMKKQFADLGIALDVRTTSYNRFQEKIRSGNAQLFTWSWKADYPDPENFLFLLYGPQGKVLHGGENAANYQNPTYDALFGLMKSRDNDTKRQHLIDRMMAILRHDAPWAWGTHSELLMLTQGWVYPHKINPISQATLKYISIDVSKRQACREAWNQPVLWPIVLIALLLVLMLLPFMLAYRQRLKSGVTRIPL